MIRKGFAMNNVGFNAVTSAARRLPHRAAGSLARAARDARAKGTKASTATQEDFFLL